MYTCMVFALAELSSTISTAGGGYGFGRRALGVVGRLPHRHGDPDRVRDRARPRSSCSSAATSRRSTSSGSPAAGRSTSRSTPSSSASTCSAWARRSRSSFVITAIAVVALVVFVVAMIPEFDTSNLTDIAPDGRGRRVGLPALRLRGHLGRVPVRDLVLPGRRGRPARGGGDARPEARHAARADRRDDDPARLRRADAHARARAAAGRRGDPGLRQPAAGRRSTPPRARAAA